MGWGILFSGKNPYKIDVMINSLIEMLELSNSGHMNTSTVWFESLGKILLVTSLTEIMALSRFFQNTFILWMFRVANFADIIKIATMFIETTFKDSKKVKRIRNYVLMQFKLVFPDLTKVETFAEKYWR